MPTENPFDAIPVETKISPSFLLVLGGLGLYFLLKTKGKKRRKKN